MEKNEKKSLNSKNKRRKKTMITRSTQKQWHQIEKIKKKWLDIPSTILTDDQIRQAVNDLWQELFNKKPAVVIIADSPLSGAIMAMMLKPHSQLRSQLYSQLRSQLGSQLYSLRSQLDSQLLNSNYTSIFLRALAGWFEGAKILGVQFDKKKYNLLQRFALAVPQIFCFKTTPIVSRNPITVHWHNNLLHNSDGPSVLFRDGYSVWTIDGIPVDEQIVLRPQTQTLEQIDAEQNQDVKSIRIERFGWLRYLKESKSKCCDSRHNIVENTQEALYVTAEGDKRLVVTCPTGRIFALGVPKEITTCEAAQHWLSGGKNFNVLART